MTLAPQVDDFAQAAEEVIRKILEEKARLGVSAHAPIRAAFATETRDGLLPRAIQLYGEDILESVGAVTSHWEPRAHRLVCHIAGEELIVTLRAD
jgi:hypothetical protein